MGTSPRQRKATQDKHKREMAKRAQARNLERLLSDDFNRLARWSVPGKAA